MKRTKIQLLSILLCAVMLMLVLPTIVLAAEDMTYVWDIQAFDEQSDSVTLGAETKEVSVEFSKTSLVASGTCGERITWKLDTNGLLTISGTGNMENYSDMAEAPWWRYFLKIRRVVIKDGVTTVGDWAFLECEQLTEVVLPDSLTAIGACAFRDCQQLPVIEIPVNVKYIGGGAFSGTKLETIVIPKSVTEIGKGLFSNCSYLKKVTIKGKLTSIPQDAFSGCHVLEQVNIPGSVISIGKNAFSMCHSLRNITVPDSVTLIGENAFYGCKALTELELGKNVASIGNYALHGCNSLSGIHVDAENRFFSSDKYGVLFDKNKTVLIRMPGKLAGHYFVPDGVTKIGDYAAHNCDELISVTIPGSVIMIGSDAFHHCDNLANVTLSEGLQVIGTSAFANTSVQQVKFPCTVAVLGSGVFNSSWDMTSVVFCGDMPAFEWDSLSDVTVKYPAGNRTWTWAAISKLSMPVRWESYDTISIIKQPRNVTVAAGKTAKVTVTAQGKGLTYRWYYANSGAEYFTYTPTYRGATYSVKMNSVRSGRRVYCVITDAQGNSTKSDTVVLGMGTPLKITKQPMDVTAYIDKAAEVTVEAEGEGLTYRWYYIDKGRYFRQSGVFKSTFYRMSMSNKHSGRRVYCVITDKYGNSVQTKTVTLTRRTWMKITKQPVSASAYNGKSVKVTVGVKGDGLTYKWYYANPGSDKFTYTSTYKGNSYGVTMNADRDGRRVYCVITDAYGRSVTTKTVTLSMRTWMKITEQPVSVAVKKDSMAKVTVGVQGDGLTYKWYYANPGSDTFKLTDSFTGKSYSISMNAARSGRRVYCVITDQYGRSVKTDIVTLKMK